eukprot:TRINITY_DN6318_c0_g1_i2.p2 TRINITY_DN6318_c0_g1~~TRINITY_DN6318_c0_g1_i2.p2  ORF type:complete len:132 (+),score=37.83 TRINITY_DN6318_c0_g1_i2:90-485(+)
MLRSLVGSEMCIRDRVSTQSTGNGTSSMEQPQPSQSNEDKTSQQQNMCKRKKGLYQKAEELATLCGVQVAVVIVGDGGDDPTQMVATGHGNYEDLPSCYRVLNRYTEAVRQTPLETPAAAMDARQTLEQQE